MNEPKINSFCWAELCTKDGQAAKKFYTGLFGWNYIEEELPEGMGQYITFMVNGKPAGAMCEMALPPHWGCYVRVDNCDEATKKAKSLGAEIIKEPFDVMDAGRMSVIKDPQGAYINLWQKNTHAGAADQGAVGSTCWHELMVDDPEKALDFYSKLLGWSAEKSEFDGKTYYSLKMADQTPVGGMMKTCAENPCPPAWSTYFTVSDLERAMKYIEKNGGKIHMGPEEVHGMGHFAICEDNQGAHFAIFEFMRHTHGHGEGCC